MRSAGRGPAPCQGCRCARKAAATARRGRRERPCMRNPAGPRPSPRSRARPPGARLDAGGERGSPHAEQRWQHVSPRALPGTGPRRAPAPTRQRRSRRCWTDAGAAAWAAEPQGRQTGPTWPRGRPPPASGSLAAERGRSRGSTLTPGAGGTERPRPGTFALEGAAGVLAVLVAAARGRLRRTLVHICKTGRQRVSQRLRGPRQPRRG